MLAAQESIEKQQQGTTFRLGHRPALDGLRGLFVLIVIALHADIPWARSGGLGVDGFFVLSGFLITCILLQEWNNRGRISIKSFYMRRALRLWPALYVLLLALTVLWLVHLAGDLAQDTERGIVLSAFYVSNWMTFFFGDYNVGLGFMGHSWSLAIEEQFYLVWPILLVGLLSLRLTPKKLAICVGGLTLAAVVWRIWLVSAGTNETRLFLGTDTRADELLVGCTLGVVMTYGLIKATQSSVQWSKYSLLPAAVILGYALFLVEWPTGPVPYYGGFTVIALCIAAVIMHVLIAPAGRMSKLLSWQPLVKLGVVSYGVYLWHYPVFRLFEPGSAGWLDLPMQLTRLVVLVMLVTLSYRYVEKPMLRLKEKLSKRAQGEASAENTEGTTSTKVRWPASRKAAIRSDL